MGRGGERPPSKLVASEFAWQEVTKHRTPEDAWLVCNNKVYDVSGWHEHPGGDVIFTAAGDDATDSFSMFHARGTTKHLDQFCIGQLDETSRKQYSNESPKSQEQIDFEKGYRALRQQIKKLGLFESSPLYYAYKMLSTLSIALVAAYLIATHTSTTGGRPVRVGAAALLGLYFQQCGWLAHEVLHHQVFSTRRYGHYCALIWGNLAQGFSCSWWMNKHNTHHSVPNVHATGADAQNGDPDIDTMPLLAWSKPMLKLVGDSKFAAYMVKHQHVFYLPILAFARLSWLQQSVAYVLNLDETAGRAVKGTDKLKPVPYERTELFLLGLHYAWYFALAALHPSFLDALLFLLVSNVVCGLTLAIVFGLGHNGMAVYDAANRPDYWKLQVTTTRNVTQDPFGFVHWFCGGLDYQVEHHLFPTVPRHNLAKVCDLTKEFCHKHGVRYHTAGILQGTWEVLTHLHTIAQELVADFPAM
mmetsp:Transcript_6309/g.19759  ORF Transcript_6309/g.19759 Transcript_6309/m.19759 type:complete len:472 (-) Transcript_6309:446-1861(-)